ncbi:MAG TPA: guanine deaminase, partial [Gammaproteobacteria bacterium]|nr:guanine deaminase [Gammaproteobacteria bacterium]
MNSVACRGRILYFVESPRKAGRDAWRYLEDGLLWIEDGYVREVGEYSLLAGRIPDSLPLRNYS